MHNFKEVVKDKNLITVFYECGAGGEFLVWLLGMNQHICSRNMSVDESNRWRINDNFCRMAGKGMEDSLPNWQFPPNYKYYIARDHANLLCPSNKWRDNLDRDLETGIKDFNNLYSKFWNDSKAIWLNISDVKSLQLIDRLGALKNFGSSHVHLSETEYTSRFSMLKERMTIKQSRFEGATLHIDFNDLWFSKTDRTLKEITNFLSIDNDYIEVWKTMIDHWNRQNDLLMNKTNCIAKNCVPIEL